MTDAIPVVSILSGEQSCGRSVTVQGWVRTRRDAKEFSFIEINDGSSLANLQIIAEASMKGYRDTVLHLTTGSSVIVAGELRESQGKGQRYELLAATVTPLGIAPPDYPLQKKRHSFEFLR
jgi:asparaginyl-tRNA synthetase